MLGAIMKMLGKDSKSSKDIARERLRLVLVHDRASVTPQFMEVLKDDMIKVISNYMDINEKEMEVNFTKDESSVALVANIPVNRMKHQCYDK
ncbi:MULTISPECIES: cell division topological specificity factor MinE [Anaerosinus]|uniref:Cell division topological specificity factor n=1 Tax=Selenobaculum gibii TaxID=3054208 RepID=A0A9Y2AK53_9FIRM|nr:cell division topological specificity factor MinE [Selenobaculum gbiensis]WIW71407.1 cell division topological specificity factor MinE [Selenobaculum gbiensis]